MKHDNEKDIKENGSGYRDPTAYKAIKNVIKDEKFFMHVDETERFNKFLNIIFSAADLAGFRIENRLVIKDKKTGKIWN